MAVFRRRVISAAVLLLAALLLGGCGLLQPSVNAPDESKGELSDKPTVKGFERVTLDERRALDDKIEMGVYGKDEYRVYILKRPDAPPDQPLLIWLHGYGSNSIAGSEKWLAHLTRRATVVFPAYARAPFPAGKRYGNLAWPIVAKSLRPVLRRIDYDPRKLVVAGYSLGGAMANDYARAARSEGLPTARGIYSVYMGRRLKGSTELMLPRQPGEISAQTELFVMASTNDLLAGTREAKWMMANSPKVPKNRKKIRIVRSYELGDHFGPTRTRQRNKVTFWYPLDRLIDRVAARADAAEAAQARATSDSSVS